jgi:hypothetical protein
MLKMCFWNTGEHRLRALWRLILQFAVFFAVLLTFASILKAGGKITLPRAFMAGLFYLGAGFGAAWLVARFIDRRPFADYGWSVCRSRHGIFGEAAPEFPKQPVRLDGLLEESRTTVICGPFGTEDDSRHDDDRDRPPFRLSVELIEEMPSVSHGGLVGFLGLLALGLFLIIDDDRESCLTLASLLERSGYGVITVPDGWQALDTIRAGMVPDAILRDRVWASGFNGKILVMDFNGSLWKRSSGENSGKVSTWAAVWVIRFPVSRNIQCPRPNRGLPLRSLFRPMRGISGPSPIESAFFPSTSRAASPRLGLRGATGVMQNVRPNKAEQRRNQIR